MSYLALARKWRPRRFEELVGQEHVVRALSHALSEGRVHQALLFSGTRGVGKTTIARIVAKSLNCEQGVGPVPCDQCDSCREIDEGRFVDLIEVDAASRTRVDDTRELLDNVQYAPVRGRVKVYLIDEVHMLSTHSFNALLKTLEEPPPHVQFLLATTDPQKLPVTVLSRCLQFHLKRLPATRIAAYLGDVLGHEGIEAEEGALKRLARAADGSMRDALSLLDQAIAYGGGQLQEGDVAEMLGHVDRNQVTALVEALAAGDGAAVIAGLRRLDEQGADSDAVLDELALTLQRLALLQVVPETGAGDDESEWREALVPLAARIAPEDVQLWYQTAILGRRDLPWAPDPRIGLEMTLLRMLAFRPDDAGQEAASPPRRPRSAPAEGGGGPRAPKTAPAGVPGASGQSKAERAPDAPAAPESVPTPIAEPEPSGMTPPDLPESVVVPFPEGPRASAPPAPGNDAREFSWEAVIPRLGLRGMADQLARHCVCSQRDAKNWTLTLAPQVKELLTDRARARLEGAIREQFGADLKVRIVVGDSDADTPAQKAAQRSAERLREAEQAIEEDPNVRSLRERLGASVRPGSIEPLDDE